MRLLGSIVFLSTALFLLQGCTSTQTTQHLEIFRDGEKPNRDFKEIGILTDDGGLAEQGEIEQQMVKRAKKMGADAIWFEKLTQTGDELKGFGLQKTYLYKAHAVVFTGKQEK
jgi:hypothetical protein